MAKSQRVRLHMTSMLLFARRSVGNRVLHMPFEAPAAVGMGTDTREKIYFPVRQQSRT